MRSTGMNSGANGRGDLNTLHLQYCWGAPPCTFWSSTSRGCQSWAPKMWHFPGFNSRRSPFPHR